MSKFVKMEGGGENENVEWYFLFASLVTASTKGGLLCLVHSSGTALLLHVGGSALNAIAMIFQPPVQDHVLVTAGLSRIYDSSYIQDSRCFDANLSLYSMHLSHVGVAVSLILSV